MIKRILLLFFSLAVVQAYGQRTILMDEDPLYLIRPVNVSPVIEQADWYVAPWGDDPDPGTFAKPFFTLETVWDSASAGDLVYLLGGTYAYDNQQILTGLSGTASDPIKIWAYPGEIPNISVTDTLDLGYPAGLIWLEGDYTYWKGIEISENYQKSGNTNIHWGMQVTSSSHNIFENFNVHHNGGGLAILGEWEGGNGPADSNLVLNGDFHDNWDPYSASPYGNADGLQIAYVDSGEVNWARGNRMWNNSDDGLDLWSNDGYTNLDSNWAWHNGYQEDSITAGGNGTGFKLGSVVLLDNTVFGRTLQNNLAVLNAFAGFSDNTAPCKMIFNNNISCFNTRGYRFFVETSEHEFTNDAYYGNPTYDHGSDMVNSTFITCSYNALNHAGGVVTTDADFVSRDSTLLDSPRQSDGGLPDITYLHLETGSDLIDAGTDVGLPYLGDNPDIGAFEKESFNLIAFIIITLVFINGKNQRRLTNK